MASSFAVLKASDMPTISVIIPMYSAGKYIGECLESLLNQTFQDFEVIAVDGGSTDSGVEVVKKYIDKFNRRLRLVKTEENTGNLGELRNAGISLAAGEYIYCLEGGDALTATALEEMCALAQKFDADVVYCEKYYTTTGTGQEFKDNVRIAADKIQKPPFVDKPTLETDDLAERVRKFLAENYAASPSLRLVKRDLLTCNNITFPSLVGSEDVVWSMEILFCAKRFLRVPNIYFIKRAQEKEISLMQYAAPNQVRRLMDLTIRSLKDLDNFMQEIKFFRENPRQRYNIINRAVSAGFADFFKKYAAQSPFDVYNIFQKKFGEYTGDQDVLVSSLCAYVFNQYKTSAEIQAPATFPMFNAEESITAAKYQISVIIPLHNAEEFIGECLDSLLNQTFQKFEVIAVDCSTDNSAEIVKEYAPKFDGRLTIAQAKENPRNKGIELAGGEYLYFLDPNDTIAPTALETLHTAAKDFKADVVHCEKYYRVPDELYHDAAFRANLAPGGWHEKTFITQPTLLTNNLEKRVRDFSQKWLQCNSWLQLIRRDFLRDNKITFQTDYDDDAIFTMCELCTAKNYLVVPNALYYRRQLHDSDNLDAAQILHRYATVLKEGVKFLDEFLNGRDFFAKRTDLKYCLFDVLFVAVLGRLDDIYHKFSADELCELLRREFDNDSDSMFTAFVFNALNVYRLQLDPPQELITEPTLEIPNDVQAFHLDKEPYIFSKNLPKISVVIPMYNVEKYVGECLDSLLAQTVQNFEVIVVDDCSTDNSRAVVESYMEKFNGRLTLVQLEKNTGYAGFPRNKGIELARGEYLYFLDPDDTISTTALEELYTAAKKYNADVVHCEKYYSVPDEFYNDAAYRKKLKPYSWPNTKTRLITQPTLLTNDLEKRVKDFSQRWLQWASWMQLIRLDFLIKNGIRFLSVYSQDMVFTMCEICCAKNYLVVPNCFCYWRKHKASKTQEKQNTQQVIHRYVSTLKHGINYLDGFFERQNLFAKQTDLKSVLFNMLFVTILERLDNSYRKMPAHELDGLLRKEIGNENSAFTAFLFNAMNIYRLKLNPSPKHITVPEIELERVGNREDDFLLQKVPAVSVIIPMYNVEKYIGECLDSLLSQTLQDFEVIVVDDCSTDSSIAVVKRYIPKFDGRLRLIKTEKNTGSPGDPTNIGIDLSRGEYLFISDDDDAITPDALEKLYNTAKSFDADVVSCEKFYSVPERAWYNIAYSKDLKPQSYKRNDFVSKPTLISFDIARRVQDCYDRKFLWPLWTKLIRRDYLIKNKIRCTNNIIQDMLMTSCLIYTAKRFVHVPYVFYFWRKRDDSLSNQNRDPLKKLEKYLSALTIGFKYLDGFLSEKEIFQQNPEIKHMALDTYFREIMKSYVQPIYNEIPVNVRETVLRNEFASFENTALMIFLFNRLIKLLDYSENKIPEFVFHCTARIDVQLTPKTRTGNLQIVSVSDKQADVKRMTWLKGCDVGHFIQSYFGNMELVVKATTDGQIHLKMLSVDVRDPEDKTKRIPYWIDYQKLTVNGKTVFDKVTPAWHDKPYRYNLDVKAGAEIKIETAWLPHRDERTGISPAAPNAAPIQAKTIAPTVESDDAAILAKFKRYLSIRLDLQMLTKNKKDFQIVSISDAKADVRKPAWIQKDGVGYVIQSYAGKLDIVFKSVDGGLINMDLKGLFYADPKDETKHIPYWIDYTKFTVNETVIFKKRTPIWHDKPYNYTMEAKAGEDITVSFEWLPHRSDT